MSSRQCMVLCGAACGFLLCSRTAKGQVPVDGMSAKTVHEMRHTAAPARRAFLRLCVSVFAARVFSTLAASSTLHASSLPRVDSFDSIIPTTTRVVGNSYILRHSAIRAIKVDLLQWRRHQIWDSRFAP